MIWSFRVPMQIPSGNRLVRTYARRHGMYKRLRDDFGLFVQAYSKHIPKATGPRHLTITRVIAKGGRKYDYDNLVTGVKPYLDAIKLCGLITNDDPSSVTVEYRQERGDQVETVVEVRDLVATWEGMAKP